MQLNSDRLYTPSLNHSFFVKRANTKDIFMNGIQAKHASSLFGLHEQLYLKYLYDPINQKIINKASLIFISTNSEENKKFIDFVNNNYTYLSINDIDFSVKKTLSAVLRIIQTIVNEVLSGPSLTTEKTCQKIANSELMALQQPGRVLTMNQAKIFRAYGKSINIPVSKNLTGKTLPTLTTCEKLFVVYLRPLIQEALTTKISMIFIDISPQIKKDFINFVHDFRKTNKLFNPNLNEIVHAVITHMQKGSINALDPIHLQAEDRLQKTANIALKTEMDSGYVGQVITRRQAEYLTTCSIMPTRNNKTSVISTLSTFTPHEQAYLKYIRGTITKKIKKIEPIFIATNSEENEKFINFVNLPITDVHFSIRKILASVVGKVRDLLEKSSLNADELNDEKRCQRIANRELMTRGEFGKVLTDRQSAEILFYAKCVDSPAYSPLTQNERLCIRFITPTLTASLEFKTAFLKVTSDSNEDFLNFIKNEDQTLPDNINLMPLIHTIANRAINGLKITLNPEKIKDEALVQEGANATQLEFIQSGHIGRMLTRRQVKWLLKHAK